MSDLHRSKHPDLMIEIKILVQPSDFEIAGFQKKQKRVYCIQMESTLG
jgi:hypothetical protein